MCIAILLSDRRKILIYIMEIDEWIILFKQNLIETIQSLQTPDFDTIPV